MIQDKSANSEAEEFSKELIKQIQHIDEITSSGMDKYILGILKCLDDNILSNHEIELLPMSEVIRRGRD